jgi:hypothetical protein
MITNKKMFSILFTILISISQTMSQTGHITYTLHRESNPSEDQSDAYQRITTAMDSAIGYYNKYTSLTKDLNIYYDTGVPTADASFNGTIRFGSNRGFMITGTAMHEMAHTIGAGTTYEYRNLIQNGRFIGPQTTAMLRQITGNANDSLSGDTQHFWPYGINYASEVRSDADLINHCKIVNAIYQDMFNEKLYGVYRIQSKLDRRYIVPSGTDALTLSNQIDSSSLVRIIALLNTVNTFRFEFGSKVLDNTDQSTQPGTAVGLWSWNGGDNQKVVLEFEHPDTTTVRIKILNSGLYLRASGNNIIQDNSSVSPESQYWKLIAPNQLEQTIFFSELPPHTYGDAPFSISASASSGLAVSFTSSDTSVAVISGNLITIKRAGSTTISAVQNGSETYKAANTVQQLLTVGKKPLSVTGVTVSNKIYDGTTIATLSGSGTLSGVVSGDNVILVSGSGVFANKNAGTGKAVTTSGFSISGTDASNYTLNQPSGLTADITVAQLTIKANDAEKGQNRTYPVFTITYSGFITGDNSTVVSGLTIKRQAGETPGSYAIVPSGATALNYAITFVNGTLAIKASTAVLQGNVVKEIKKNRPLTGIYIKSNPVLLSSQKADFRIVTDAPSEMRIIIYDALGNPIFNKNTSSYSNTVDMSWDFYTRNGHQAGCGTYLIVANIHNKFDGSKLVLTAKLGLKQK